VGQRADAVSGISCVLQVVSACSPLKENGQVAKLGLYDGPGHSQRAVGVGVGLVLGEANTDVWRGDRRQAPLKPPATAKDRDVDRFA
jgi:hypothetical protein